MNTIPTRFPAPKIGNQTAVLTHRAIRDHVYHLYRVPDLDRLVDEIDPDTWKQDEKMPYWAELWPSGVALAELLASDAAALRHARVLELGCGLGLPSIVAAHLGAQVTATDYYPEALDLLHVNAALNGVSLRTREVDWRTPPDLGRFDVVIAADVLYERWQTPAMVDMLARTVLPQGKAFVVDPDRITAKDFASAATFRGFRVGKEAACHTFGVTGPFSVYTITWKTPPGTR